MKELKKNIKASTEDIERRLSDRANTKSKSTVKSEIDTPTIEADAPFSMRKQSFNHDLISLTAFRLTATKHVSENYYRYSIIL